MPETRVVMDVLEGALFYTVLTGERKILRVPGADFFCDSFLQSVKLTACTDRLWY